MKWCISMDGVAVDLTILAGILAILFSLFAVGLNRYLKWKDYHEKVALQKRYNLGLKELDRIVKLFLDEGWKMRKGNWSYAHLFREVPGGEESCWIYLTKDYEITTLLVDKENHVREMEVA